MKLATLKDSTRDGKLVVVSKDLTRCSEVGHIARTLQAALDDWAHVAPRLERVAIGLETGSQPTMRFHEHDAASPLPRAFSWSGGAGFFNGPRDSIGAVSDVSLASSVQAAVIVDDTQAGSQTGDIALVMLAHGVLKDGNPIAVAFSPVAVTPDEIEGWDNGNAALQVIVGRNGKATKTTQTVDFNSTVTAAVRERSLGAGSVLAAETGAATPVAIGDVVRVEMNDRTGHSIFGAIEQTVQAG